MRFVYFTHSLRSCWNHGNAHFLRGVLKELLTRGHSVQAFEPECSWSAENLVADQGIEALQRFEREYPELTPATYKAHDDLALATVDADIVIAHEWNEPWVIASLGRLRRQGGGFVLLFHDTHHRTVSDAAWLHRLNLSDYDGILTFGNSLAQVYRTFGWGGRVFVWHEAADTRLFRPPSVEQERSGLVWIGNWGDDERSKELRTFLMAPSRDLKIPLNVYGVRYPHDAVAMLRAHSARYLGWVANVDVPTVFATHLATVHVPRRYYVHQLNGIPTIRVFEALACGIPLVCAPWDDTENLFQPGEDYLVARSGEEMRRHLNMLIHDTDVRCALVSHGLETIRRRHSCSHRVDELLAIAGQIQMSAAA
jgi:spore maturation protein CgeB